MSKQGKAEQVGIDERNRIIADFFGKADEDGIYIFPIELYDSKTTLRYSKRHFDVGLCFEKSWDWLMPVVEKICRLKVGDGVEYVDYSYPRTFGMVNEDTGKLMVRLNGHTCFEAETLIEATWLAVVDFIKWHKQQSLTP